MVPRARIGLATPAFSGPRSTGELPRHRCVKRFYGKFGGVTNENGVRRKTILGAFVAAVPQGGADIDRLALLVRTIIPIAH
jgi:hypothetical protein